MERMLRIALTIVALLLCGCARSGPFSTDPKIATRQVSELIPKGTSQARAKETLIARGFHLSELNPNEASDHLLVGTCTIKDTTWQVGLIIIKQKVAASSVTVSVGGVVRK
jgi:hypothetical protein